ncbi:MAG TPA: hypothetical protein VG799_06565 [Gemmatimonadota bacterium]|nr:hypothetical protein [Gemmatimonadota bacterium]
MHPAPETKPTVNLGDHAVDDLKFIRRAMERAGSFTAVPGWGGVGMGVTALGAAFLAAAQPTPARWLTVWLVAALVATAIGLWTMVRKARRLDVPLATGAGRKFALGLLPPILVGAILTAALLRAGVETLLPAVWLLLYGTGIVAAGAFSVAVVPLQGLAFLILGGAALLVPEAGDLLLGLGFGVVNLVFGIVIAVRHGG